MDKVELSDTRALPATSVTPEGTAHPAAQLIVICVAVPRSAQPNALQR